MVELLRSKQTREPLPSEKALNEMKDQAGEPPTLEDAVRNCEKRIAADIDELKRRLPNIDRGPRITLTNSQ